MFIEQDRAITSHGTELAGTLCMPEVLDVKAVVLMLPGSGEIDRNENAAHIQLNTLNAVAHGLAAAGIASYRYDKRGCGQSGGKYFETGYYDFVSDAENCLHAVAQFPECAGKSIYLLGHSEGTLTAAFLGTRQPALINGIVLLNPFMETIEVTMRRQLRQTLEDVRALTGFRGFVVKTFLKLSGDQEKKQKRLLDRVRSTGKSSIKVKKQVLNAKWLREISSIEPSEIYKDVTIPMLSIGGEKDVQCLPEDARRVKEAAVDADVEVHILPDLTHILRVDEEKASTFRYRELTDKDIDTRVVELATAWIQRSLS